MKLRFTPEALAEIDSILSGLADKSPSGAASLRRRIEALLDRLLDYPFHGAPTSLPQLRRIVIRPYPYLLFYQTLDNAVVVIGLRHAARDPRSMPGAPPGVPPPES